MEEALKTTISDEKGMAWRTMYKLIQRDGQDLFYFDCDFYFSAKSLNFLQPISLCAHQPLCLLLHLNIKGNLEGLSPRQSLWEL